MNKMNLKPCPFCGSKNVELEHCYRGIVSSTKCAYIQCKSCGAKTDEVFISTAYSCDEKAIELWNKRSEDKCDSGTTKQ